MGQGTMACRIESHEDSPLPYATQPLTACVCAKFMSGSLMGLQAARRTS
jgi:hypothetical protein